MTRLFYIEEHKSKDGGKGHPQGPYPLDTPKTRTIGNLTVDIAANNQITIGNIELLRGDSAVVSTPHQEREVEKINTLTRRVRDFFELPPIETFKLRHSEIVTIRTQTMTENIEFKIFDF